MARRPRTATTPPAPRPLDPLALIASQLQAADRHLLDAATERASGHIRAALEILFALRPDLASPAPKAAPDA